MPKLKTTAYYKRKRTERRNHNQGLRQLLHSLKDVPCQLCGVKYAPWVMHFDHLDHKTKLFSVGESLGDKTRKAILEEVKKCRVICANCHADVTYKNRYIYKEKGFVEVSTQQEFWN